jgi:hypothetical protein
VESTINAIKNSMATLMTRVKARCLWMALDPCNLMQHGIHRMRHGKFKKK